MSEAERLAEALDAKATRTGWQAHCPAHDDSKPSLSIAEGESQAVVLHCHRGCTFDEVTEALRELGLGDFKSNGSRSPRAERGTFVESYTYCDEHAQPLLRVNRYSDKSFPQDRWERGRWMSGLRDDTRRVLYELPRVLRAVAEGEGEVIYLVEGEKDANALIAKGYTATTNPQGAKSWAKVAEHAADVLAGAVVVIVADRDREGYNLAAERLATLTPVAESVTVVRAAVGKDVSDHLAAGLSVDDLEAFDLAAELAEAEQAKGNGHRDAPAKRVSRERVVRLIDECYRLGRSDDGRAFVAPHEGPNVALFQRDARRHVCALALARLGHAPSRKLVDEVWDVSEGRALALAPEALPLRVARAEGGELVIDLADETGRAVLLSAAGWRVVERSPVTFRRSGIGLPLPTPVGGSGFDDLWLFVNVDPDYRDVLIAWLVAALIPEIPHPIPSLNGEQGSAKTTSEAKLAALIDPCSAETQGRSRSEDRWASACSARYLIPVDNVSEIPEWWSDAMCRAVTGDGFVRRKLYTDDDVAANRWKRVILLNGITLGYTVRPDLAERLMPLELRRPEAFRSDLEVAQAFDEAHPRLVGALLDRAVIVLAHLADARPPEGLRMADFAKVLAAHDDAFGTTTVATYTALVEEALEEAAAGDDFAQALIEYVEAEVSEGGRSSITLKTLVSKLTVQGDHFPTTARGVSEALKRARLPLRRAGIHVTRPARTNNASARSVVITRDKPSEPKPSEPDPW